jgi:O-antigen/teichoic acid export membrane protein
MIWKRLVRTLGANLVTTAFASGTTVLLTLAASHAFTTDEFASFVNAYAAGSLLALIADAGLGLRLFERTATALDSARVQTFLRARIAGTLLGAVAVAGVAIFSDAVYGGVAYAIAFGSALTVYITALTLCQSRNDFRLYRYLQLGNGFVYGLATVATILGWVKTGGALIAALSIGLALAALPTVVLSWRRGEPQSLPTGGGALKGLWPFATSTWAAAATTQTPILFLSHDSGPADVGAFALADRTIGTIGIVGSALQTLLLPLMARRDSLLRESLRIGIIGCLLSPALAVGVAAAVGWLLQLLVDPAATPSLVLLSLLTCAYLLGASVIPIATEILAAGRIRLQASAALVQAAIVLLTLLLTRRWGAEGAAVAVLAGRCFYSAGLLALGRSHLAARARAASTVSDSPGSEDAD